MMLVEYDPHDEILCMLSCCLRAAVFRSGTLSKQRRRYTSRLAGVGWRSGKHALLTLSADQPEQREEDGRGMGVRYRRAGRFADQPDHRRQWALSNHPNTNECCPECRGREIAREI